MSLFYFWCNITVNSTSMGDKEFGSGSNMNISVDDYEIDDMLYVDHADHTEKVNIHI